MTKSEGEDDDATKRDENADVDSSLVVSRLSLSSFVRFLQNLSLESQ